MLGKDRTLPTPFVLAIIGLGAFITALDQTVVVTALPSVMLDLKVPIAELDRVSWIITAYLLGYTVAMPLIGRLGDVYGYPRVYQASLVVFCVGTGFEPRVDGRRQGDSSSWRRRNGPHRDGFGDHSGPKRAARPGLGRGWRISRGRRHVGSGLRRSDRRAPELALDILA